MKIVTFGEVMLRLTPNLYDRFVQANTFNASFGGAEANVAVSLAQFGLHAAFVTKLPKHEIGESALWSLRKVGVDTSHIARGGERVGIYFLEKGASQRASKVVYDRTNSSIATAHAEDFDWNQILQGADWFHFTGITPALSDELASILLEALKQAKKRGIFVSTDLNYRAKLWTKEKANSVMSSLMSYVDLCIANEQDAEDVFGIKSEHSSLITGEINKEEYIEVAQKLQERFGFQYVAITLRESLSANVNNWSAMLYNGKKSYFSKTYNIQIVDRVGGGDSFGAGLIYALSQKYTSQEAIEFAVAASCLKHTIEGDYNFVTVEEVKKLMGGDGSGRVSR